MRMPPVIELVARLDARTLKHRIKRSFALARRRETRIRAHHIELPRKLRDRIVLLMFACCFFTFLHAFFGFGIIDEDLGTLNDTFVLPHPTFSISLPWNQGSGVSNGDQERHTRGVTRVTVDWHGNCELLPSITSVSVSPASIPQDAFPDPTPTLVRAGCERTPNEGIPSTTTKIKPPMDAPFTFNGTPYDPFRLGFEDSVDGDDIRGPYPFAGPPRTVPKDARTRRFGRCFLGKVACL